jgi:hypothetical protein
VAKATGTFETHAAVNATYTTTLTLANISLTNGYVWNAPTTVLNAGNNQSFAATYTNPNGNYEPATGTIIVNVAKATGTFGTHAAVNAVYTTTLTLANITLTSGYVWNAPTTVLNAGNNQSFAATYINPNGNYEPAIGSIIVNVAKATYNMDGITFMDVNITYDGAAHSIFINGTLPTGVTVNYTGNGQIEAGTYLITAIFEVADEANYNTQVSPLFFSSKMSHIIL